MYISIHISYRVLVSGAKYNSAKPYHSTFRRETDCGDSLPWNLTVGTEDIPHVLVGNKNDLVHEREVACEEGQRLADEWGVPFIESSAKYNTNVEEVFRKLIATCEARSEVNLLSCCVWVLFLFLGQTVMTIFVWGFGQGADGEKKCSIM